MRIRTVKPSFHTHEDLSLLPAEVHLFAAALLNYADDEGFFNANPALVKGACCPIRKLNVEKAMDLLAGPDVEFLRLGKDKRGRRYGHIVNFKEHQTVNRPTPSKIKGLEIVWEQSVGSHGELSEDSSQERKGKERNNISVQIELLWKSNPKKTEKKLVEDQLRSALKKAEFETILSSWKAYLGKTEPKYVKALWRWLRDERWTDEDLAYAPGEVMDIAEPDDWRKLFGDPKRPAWERQWKAHFKNKWPIPGANFPDGCPPEILATYYPEEM